MFVESCKKVILKFRSISDIRILHSYLFVKLKKVICEIKKNERFTSIEIPDTINHERKVRFTMETTCFGNENFLSMDSVVGQI